MCGIRAAKKNGGSNEGPTVFMIESYRSDDLLDEMRRTTTVIPVMMADITSETVLPTRR